MTTINYRRAEVDGLKVFYREAGRADAPTLLLLHGFPSAGHMSPRAAIRHTATEQRDELAALHSITSSARASNVGAISKPMALAVLRLTISSNFVGCSTGRSSGLAPRRTLASIRAHCRKKSEKCGP